MHGINYLGVHDSRVQHLAKCLALLGYRIILPEIEKIKKLKVDALDSYEAFFKILSLSKIGSVKLILISFSGGLALTALSKKYEHNPITDILTIGSFSNFKKTINYANKNYEDDYYALYILFYNYYYYISQSENMKNYFYFSLIYNSQGLKCNEYLKIKNKLSKRELIILNKLENNSDFRFDLCRKIINENHEAIYKLSPINHCHLLDKKIKINILHGSEDKIISKDESVNLYFALDRTHQVNLFLTDFITHGERKSLFDNIFDVPKIANFLNNFLKD